MLIFHSYLSLPEGSSGASVLFAQDPCNVLEIHPLHLAGESVDSKLRRVREAIQEQKASCILLRPGRTVMALYQL